MPNENTAAILSLDQVARELGVSRMTIRSAAHRGELPVVTVGKRIYTTRAGLAEYLTPRRLTPSTTT